ncbi:transglutaminase domain-containing protein [Paenibacillus arenilitoris]|uniref:Transglutaminase domain-containing protein n=1 Tax=Paenibacillus arenilitoris TaxID=2772299 RepID=A0A927CMW8_9BACL|nr:transglutaminase domain-containing protein [Paenibacillus arenilitoris]MBD2870959.1 transglutaminase domain-containing protein [Paenibacillus arenilitoris]
MAKQTSVFSLEPGKLALIERKFREKRKLAEARERELFGIFEEELTDEETWALKYLYAYMPANDLADYDGTLFLSHVRQTLDIRRKAPWGARVPDHLFLHFVLPYRVNTENIEDSRGLLHNELAARTADLSMAEAILETNYWCHEKATYIGSDLRTASPLTMIRCARGRCGEESTLAVAALRSIGIPARQVYTPRWAHCDDNHAWVEAWADGAWHYIGACEPEPRLDRGWFTPPARRAMLVNTRVFANYPGPEPVTLADEWFTEINLIDGYAPSRTVAVRVTGEDGLPAGGAAVYFELYNYAELFPIAELPANELGEASFKTGFGDLMIRAAKDGKWGERKVSAADGGIVDIVLDRSRQPEGTVDFDMFPPPERSGEAAEEPGEEELLAHNRRIEEGTRIRTAGERTYMNEEQAAELARLVRLPEDRVRDVLRKARGNGCELAAFLQERTGQYGEWPLRLLESLNEKDLIDTFRPALDDHLTGSLSRRGELPDDLFVPYVLRPRVLYEMITPYRQLFQAAYTEAEADAFRTDPAALARRLDEEFGLWEDLPNLKGKGTPAGTFKLKKGDRLSVAILFVAICRSLGIPARLHPSEQKPQYWSDGGWHDALFAHGTAEPAEERARGALRLLRSSEVAPSYAENFTLARLEGGVYKTLVYPHGKSDVYDEPLELEEGPYRLTTGIRLKDGTVRARFAYFEIRDGETSVVPLAFREAELALPVLGRVERDDAYVMSDGTDRTLGELIGEDGAIVAWLEPEREPTKHLLREIGELAVAFAELGAPIVLVAEDGGIDPAGYPALPPNAVFVRTNVDASLPALLSQPPAAEAGFPHLAVLDGMAQIRYTASGYRIGTGKEAMLALSGVRRPADRRD